MNVYDFDKTVYNGDSSVDFFIFALKKKPSLIRYLPKQFKGFLLYAMKRIEKRELKEYFFCFLSGIDALDLSEVFWKKNYKKIYDWYLNQSRADDIIISASPEFLLKPIVQRLKVGYLIASKVDHQNGKFLSENCKGDEKVCRLAEECHIMHIDNFYSDSLSDLPLASIAKRSFLVKNGMTKEWVVQ